MQIFLRFFILFTLNYMNSHFQLSTAGALAEVGLFHSSQARILEEFFCIFILVNLGFFNAIK